MRLSMACSVGDVVKSLRTEAQRSGTREHEVMRDSLFSWAPVRVPPFELVVEISFRSDAAETRCTYVTLCLDIGVRFLKQHGG